MLITLNNQLFNKPDYSTLYQSELEEFQSALRRGESHNPRMQCMKMARMVAFITELLCAKQIDSASLDPRLANLCAIWWQNKTPVYDVPGTDFNVYMFKNYDGLGNPIPPGADQSIEELLHFAKVEPPTPPSYLASRLPQVLEKETNLELLKSYFGSLVWFCDQRLIPKGPELDTVGIHGIEHRFTKAYNAAHARFKKIPTADQLLLGRDPSLTFTEDMDRYKKVAKPLGRPRVEKVETEASIAHAAAKARFNAALQRIKDLKKDMEEAKYEYNQAVEALSEFKRKH